MFSGRYVYRVRSYELGPRGRSSLASICHLLQESASLHAHELDLSPAQLLARDMTWFLARLRLRVDRYPVWRDAVTVETWPAAVEGPFAVRDFRVLDRRDEAIAVASTGWLLMDMTRRKPLRRLPQSIVDLSPEGTARASPGKPSRLPRLESPALETRVRVRRSDLDLNGHVNHVFYVAQVEQAVGAEVWDDRQVAELEIDFKEECHAGDEVLARTQTVGGSEPTFLHSLVREGSLREVARARTRWTRPDDRDLQPT